MGGGDGGYKGEDAFRNVKLGEHGRPCSGRFWGGEACGGDQVTDSGPDPQDERDYSDIGLVEVMRKAVSAT